MKKNLLFVPGFLCDTYCIIEHKSIILTEKLSDQYNIIWLTPSIGGKYSCFKNIENRDKLDEPVYVTELKKRNINFVVVDLSKLNQIKNFFIIRKICKEHKIDAILAEFGHEKFSTVFWGKILGIKTIWYEHLDPGNSKFVFIKKMFLNFFPDYFLTVSAFIKGLLPSNKPIYVVHNAVDVPEYKIISEEEKQSLKKELNLENFDNIVLVIAAFRKEKRHDLAISTAKHVINKTEKNVGFVFLGLGPLYDKYKQLITDENLSGNIIMPGHSPHVDKYLKVSNIHLLTSETEPFGLCTIEALSYNVPVINSPFGASKEIITHGEDGFIIEDDKVESYADAIIELLDNPEKRSLMGENGYKKVKESFNMPSWCDKTEKILKEIMES